MIYFKWPHMQTMLLGNKKRIPEKILISTPDPGRKGGVAMLYNTLKPFLKKDVDFFYTGTRGINITLCSNLYRIVGDYIHFAVRIMGGRYSTLIINPSLANKALLRDGIFILLSSLFNLKIIVFFHGWKEETEKQIDTRWKRLFCFVFFKANVFVVLAKKYKKKIEQWGYKGCVIVGKTCVSQDFSARVHQIKKQNSETDPSNFTILFLSRIERDKGIFEAVSIYEKLKRRNKKVKMIIAGSGDALAGVKNFVMENKLRDIEFKGFVEGRQKINIFANADCYLFTSYSEGMPLSVLEAMTAGLPIVTTPVGGVVDFFEQEQMGYMIPLTKKDLMVDRLGEIIQKKNLSRRMSKYNKIYAQQHFSALHLYDMFCKIIQDLK